MRGSRWPTAGWWSATPSASPPWPWRDEITAYRRTIDLGAPASLARGETFASDIFLNPPTEGSYTQNIPASQESWAQQLEIWLTPWGFLAGAQANGVELGTGELRLLGLGLGRLRDLLGLDDLGLLLGLGQLLLRSPTRDRSPSAAVQ